MKAWIRENTDLLAVVALALLVPLHGSPYFHGFIPTANPGDLRFVFVSNVAECVTKALAPLATLMS